MAAWKEFQVKVETYGNDPVTYHVLVQIFSIGSMYGTVIDADSKKALIGSDREGMLRLVDRFFFPNLYDDEKIVEITDLNPEIVVKK